jgi:hypothetical protein
VSYTPWALAQDEINAGEKLRVPPGDQRQELPQTAKVEKYHVAAIPRLPLFRGGDEASPQKSSGFAGTLAPCTDSPSRPGTALLLDDPRVRGSSAAQRSVSAIGYRI